MSIVSSASVTNLTEARLRSSLPAWYPGGRVDQFIRKLCFHKMGRWTEKLVWNRAANFSTLETDVGPYALDSTRNAAALDASNTALESSFTRLGDFLEVDTHQDPALYNDLIQAKKAAVVRKLGDQILNGNGQSPDLMGFDGRVDSSQRHKPVSNVPDLDDWELLASLVGPSDGLVGSGPDCFVCHGQMLRHLLKLIRSAGLTPQFDYDVELGVPVLHYCGIPVYIGQNSQSETGDTQSVWAVRIKGPTGVKLCHIEGESSEFGIQVKDLDRFTSNKAHHAKFVGGYYALLVPEIESVARMYDISTSDAGLNLRQQNNP